MLDVSWGEIIVLTGVSFVLIGRKDLPHAARTAGQQIGRIVGLIQGARLRADRFATDHQLKQLQNEFKSGLRELDAVKAELAGSMMNAGGSHRGSMLHNNSSSNNNLGALVSGVDRKKTPTINNTMPEVGAIGGAAAVAAQQSMAMMTSEGNDSSDAPTMTIASSTSLSMGAEYLAAAQQAESTSQSHSPPIASDIITSIRLAPRNQSVAAVAEEEWEKRGIGFRSVAEGRDNNMQEQTTDSSIRMSAPSISASGSGGGGAMILSNYLRQSLIYDQYERTVREQDEALRSRIEKVRNEHLEKKK